MKEKPILFGDELVRAILDGRKVETRRPIPNTWRPGIDRPYHAAHPEKAALVCPFGWPSSRLWVRECWALACAWPHVKTDGPYLYRATEVEQIPRWRPSIHMYRAASRIILEITGVRVERLQDITEDGARREGVIEQDWTGLPKRHPWLRYARFRMTPATHPDQCLGTARMAFANAWNKIYGADAWEENGWVWTISFRLAEVAWRKVERVA